MQPLASASFCANVQVHVPSLQHAMHKKAAIRRQMMKWVWSTFAHQHAGFFFTEYPETASVRALHLTTIPSTPLAQQGPPSPAVRSGPVLMAQGKKIASSLFFSLFFFKSANPTWSLPVVLGVNCRESAGQEAGPGSRRRAQGQVKAPETFPGLFQAGTARIMHTRGDLPGPPRGLPGPE